MTVHLHAYALEIKLFILMSMKFISSCWTCYHLHRPIPKLNCVCPYSYKPP